MSPHTDTLARSVLALDQRVLRAECFDALADALVHWAMEAGADGAYVGRPDAEGRLLPGPAGDERTRAYAQRHRVSIRQTEPEGQGPAGDAWRTRQVRIAALSVEQDNDADDGTPDATRWRTCAAVPLTYDGHDGGLLCLFARETDRFASPDWTLALDHVALIAGVALDRLRLGAEQNRLRELALHDPLTGLPNMTALAHHVEHASARSARSNVPLVIGVLDLDRFKPVNDLFGHDAGDHVLREVAVRLQAGLRASDFVARLAGDEFVLVLEGARDPVQALRPLFDRLYERLTQPFDIGHTAWQCGATLGLALWPNAPETTLADVLSEADRALRESKAQRDQREHWWRWALQAPAPLPALARDADPSGLYSPHLPQLASLSAALQRDAGSIVNEFYERLTRLPKSSVILESLTDFELQHLKAQQIQNLFVLADPGLAEADHRAMAMRVGRIHAMVGLEREELVRSRGLLAAAVYARLGGERDSGALQVLSRRLNRDLAWQTEAYERLQDERQQVLLSIARLAGTTENYPDLINRVVEILGTCDEVAGCSIGRPDRDGLFRVEAASGRILEKHPRQPGPGAAGAHDGIRVADLAWRSGASERCINIGTDPRMTSWQAVAKREGLCSSVAIPVCQPGHPPLAILTLHSAFPGGYSSAEQIAFTDLLQTLLAFAMGRIANLQGPTHTIPQATRQRWAALLRSDALQMHCQPIMDLRTGNVTKVEMLARLFDGSRLLMPNEFLPALTSDDFFELYVRGLGQALVYRRQWLDSGVALNVSLNLPSSALGDIRYFDATRRGLATHDCPPAALTLEILETDALPPDVDVPAELARFRALGVVLAEDDLGAGHSSLARLRELPFDWIKIDRSIVNLAGRNRSSVLNFIYQLTRLGHSLGKSVIVEGVEDDALLEAIAILKADAVQGYRIARPMPARQLLDWLAKRPAPPDPGAQPQSALGKLARLLIWEERINLVLNDAGAFERLAAIVRTSAATPPDAEPAAVPPPSLCHACPLTKFFADIEAALQDDESDSLAQRALLDAALIHRPGSAAYCLARQCLIATLGVGADAA
ncbi:EAL domain-containing protein [Paraburkholderia caballeronis]|uniref:Diguanylate cyclase DosC n=1 Tax=Paraburkholderia caballeronis TaxID=416943 RepID=A0A1H7RL22_9BURK|nr:EAL domain-containing protein [Paraburkholderia caballeronis]PXW23091.1 diguanylate cyclase (GGDEF)-like protein [Paraburkholderia caballeronis]PXW97755.1 diguanylate cyclase (GGDEF)-like protein [Paraburkholderia caballeronis]RAJ94725.1 diguanylate cyclase (GGDEF)-like protein [Paraburkholderia caballeronis]SEE60289.1 diguanylate cyclase (GGDEF) domain-containing protein [Paraburkholderia caballeronis]SEL60946.1 diguanylate cyclase (GGDEF) domain-containing protein [Paraburkholderia caball